MQYYGTSHMIAHAIRDQLTTRYKVRPSIDLAVNKWIMSFGLYQIVDRRTHARINRFEFRVAISDEVYWRLSVLISVTETMIGLHTTSTTQWNPRPSGCEKLAIWHIADPQSADLLLETLHYLCTIGDHHNISRLEDRDPYNNPIEREPPLNVHTT